MSKYKISVIIPTYKPKDYIWECLDSLSGQTLQKELFEVIIILNGCCEPYYSEINEWIFLYKTLNCKLIQTDTSGVSNARNLGIDIATGEYIAFIDDDDYVSSEFLQKLLYVSSLDVIGISNTKSFSDTDEVRQKFWLDGEYERCKSKGKQQFIYTRKFFGGPVYKLIHKDIIQGRHYDTSLTNGEDSVFMFLISDNFKYVNFTSPDAIYYRRFRVGQATSNKPFTFRFKNSIKLFKKYIVIYLNNVKKYRFSFFCTRILGVFKTLILG